MKRIFFFALLATVAIGANATTYYALNSNTPVDCETTGGPTCSSVIDSDQAYLFPADHEGGQGTQQDISDLFIPVQ